MIHSLNILVCFSVQCVLFHPYLEVPEFTGENVPVAVAARVMKKDQQFIRQGIILGFLKFGVAFKKEGSSQYDYYISPMKFWEETGFVYAGEEC